MEEGLWAKYLRKGTPAGVFLKGSEVSIKGVLVEFDDDALALMSEGSDGRSVVVVPRCEIQMVIVGMINEH